MDYNGVANPLTLFTQVYKRVPATYRWGGGLVQGRVATLLARGVLPYKRLIGMCRWMGSHFHVWSDYNGVAFSIDY